MIYYHEKNYVWHIRLSSFELVKSTLSVGCVHFSFAQNVFFLHKLRDILSKPRLIQVTYRSIYRSAGSTKIVVYISWFFISEWFMQIFSHGASPILDILMSN